MLEMEQSLENTLSPSRWQLYYRLMRLDKPIGIMLLLWPTLWALWIAGEGHPRPWVVAVFVAGVVLMRSAGCVINDFADRDFDRHVERTAERPITSGRVKPREAMLLFATLAGMSLLLVLTLNRLTLLLSLVGAFLAASYPFTKRLTHLPQAYLGAAFGWAVPMAFAAQNGSVDPRSWWIFIAVLLWAIVYDTMYAMVDRDDDLKIGIKSTAILFGRYDRLIIGLFQLAMLAVLFHVGGLFGLGAWYFGGLALAGLLMAYHQWLIRHRDRQACFRAFLHNQWVGAVIFAGIALDYLLR